MEEILKIRAFKAEDWETIKVLILESQFKEPTDLKDEKNRIHLYSQEKEIGKVYVAEIRIENPYIVGYMVLEFVGRSIFIKSLVIAKEHQRKGFGGKLIEKIILFGKENLNYNIIRTFANVEFVGAHAFLLKQGFKTCGFISHDLDYNHSTNHYVLKLRHDQDIESEKLISA